MTHIATAENRDLQASLDAFATLPEWLAASMRPERMEQSLREHVPAFGDGRLLACVPQRLRAKGDQWIARYALTVAAQDGGEPDEVVLVGHLYAPGVDAPAPEEGSYWLPDLRLLLHVETADPGLPALPSLVEPDAASRMLTDVLRDAGYGEVEITECRPEVVRYKPGSRCTVVVGLEYGDGGTREAADRTPPDLVVLKTHQGDKGATAWEAMKALWERPVAQEGTVRLAEPLAFLPDERILVQGPLAEDRTLKVLAREAIADGSDAALDELRSELAKTGHALAALHTSGAEYGRTATFEGELEEVQEVIGRLAGTIPEVAGAGAALLTRLAQLSTQVPAEALVPAHHDFRPAQVLLADGEIGFIDFDGASMAEPALDHGRFRAKLRDIGITAMNAAGRVQPGADLDEHLALMDDLCTGFTAAYLEHAPVSAERVLLWETCDLLTAMLHTWTKVRLARVTPRLIVLRHAVDALSAMTPSAAGRPG